MPRRAQWVTGLIELGHPFARGHMKTEYESQIGGSTALVHLEPVRNLL